MAADRNNVIKKILERIVKGLLLSKKYSDIKKAEVFFVFGSKHKTAMCDWVYGLKIHLLKNVNQELLNQFKLDIKKNIEKILNQSVCCTDVLIERS